MHANAMPNIPNWGYWQPNLIFNRSDCFLSVALVNNQYLLFVVSNPQHPLISSHRCERTAIECKIVLCFFLLVRLMSSWLRRHVSSWTGRRLFSAFFTNGKIWLISELFFEKNWSETAPPLEPNVMSEQTSRLFSNLVEMMRLLPEWRREKQETITNTSLLLVWITSRELSRSVWLCAFFSLVSWS